MIFLTHTQGCHCGLCHLQHEASFLLDKQPRLLWFQNLGYHIRFPGPNFQQEAEFGTASLVRFPPGDWMTQPKLAAPIRSLAPFWTTFPRRPRGPVRRPSSGGPLETHNAERGLGPRKTEPYQLNLQGQFSLIR